MFSFFESLINPYPPEQPAEPPHSLFAFVWHHCRAVWPVLLVIFALAVVIALLEVYLFAFLGTIVDWLSEADRANFLQLEGRKLAMMAFVIMVVLPGFILLHSLFTFQGMLGNFGMQVRWRSHRYLLRQSMAFFADEFAGRVAAKVMQTSLAVRDAVISILDVFTYVSIYFLGALVLVGSFHWLLAVPFFAWLVCYLLVLRRFLPRMALISRRQADARSLMTGRVVDSYTNINTVKLFSHAAREESYSREAMDEFLMTVHPQMRLSTQLELIMQLLNGALLVGAGAAGIWLWMGQIAGIGALAVAVGLVLRLNGMAHWVMWETARLFENIGVIHDGMTMLAQPHQVTDPVGGKTLKVPKGRIEFDNVRFHYGKKEGVIKQLSLAIKPGEKVGLVGRSGAGKTTLANLLLRFYDLERGCILIDGQDVADVTQDSLRANIGVVTQDTSLLHRSVRENISYGRPAASDEEIIEAAKRADAYEFIAGLEDLQGRRGLDAHVGERGVKLSGGQRQRVAIARVFLKDAPILVLDEATSALDSEVEAAIQENLFALMKGKTVIAIAHRLSTIAQLDRLVVLDAGAIVQTGTHDQLVAAGGIYADLWARQSGGFIAVPEFVDDAAQ